MKQRGHKVSQYKTQNRIQEDRVEMGSNPIIVYMAGFSHQKGERPVVSVLIQSAVPQNFKN